MSRFRRIACGWPEIHNLDLAGGSAKRVCSGARFQDKGLVGSRIHRETAPEGKAGRRPAILVSCRGGAVGNRERDRARAKPADDCVPLTAYGVRDGYKSLFRVIGNERVCERLPGHFGGSQQFRRAGASSRQSSAIRKKSNGRNGLIQSAEQVDLRKDRAGG